MSGIRGVLDSVGDVFSAVGDGISGMFGGGPSSSPSFAPPGAVGTGVADFSAPLPSTPAGNNIQAIVSGAPALLSGDSLAIPLGGPGGAPRFRLNFGTSSSVSGSNSPPGGGSGATSSLSFGGAPYSPLGGLGQSRNDGPVDALGELRLFGKSPTQGLFDELASDTPGLPSPTYQPATQWGKQIAFNGPSYSSQMPPQPAASSAVPVLPSRDNFLLSRGGLGNQSSPLFKFGAPLSSFLSNTGDLPGASAEPPVSSRLLGGAPLSGYQSSWNGGSLQQAPSGIGGLPTASVPVAASSSNFTNAVVSTLRNPAAGPPVVGNSVLPGAGLWKDIGDATDNAKEIVRDFIDDFDKTSSDVVGDFGAWVGRTLSGTGTSIVGFPGAVGNTVKGWVDNLFTAPQIPAIKTPLPTAQAPAPSPSVPAGPIAQAPSYPTPPQPTAKPVFPSVGLSITSLHGGDVGRPFGNVDSNDNNDGNLQTRVKVGLPWDNPNSSTALTVDARWTNRQQFGNNFVERGDAVPQPGISGELPRFRIGLELPVASFKTDGGTEVKVTGAPFYQVNRAPAGGTSWIGEGINVAAKIPDSLGGTKVNAGFVNYTPGEGNDQGVKPPADVEGLVTVSHPLWNGAELTGNALGHWLSDQKGIGTMRTGLTLSQKFGTDTLAQVGGEYFGGNLGDKNRDWNSGFRLEGLVKDPTLFGSDSLAAMVGGGGSRGPNLSGVDTTTFYGKGQIEGALPSFSLGDVTIAPKAFGSFLAHIDNPDKGTDLGVLRSFNGVTVPVATIRNLIGNNQPLEVSVGAFGNSETNLKNGHTNFGFGPYVEGGLPGGFMLGGGVDFNGRVPMPFLNIRRDTDLGGG